MFAVSVVNGGLGVKQGQTIDYKIVICCFSAKHRSLKE
jgi:hypothetical protein